MDIFPDENPRHRSSAVPAISGDYEARLSDKPAASQYEWTLLPLSSTPLPASFPSPPRTATELEELRAQLEEKDLLLLTTQSEHVKALSKLRQQLEQRDKNLRELKLELAKVRQEGLQQQNKTMSDALALETDREKLKEQVAILKVRLEDARERNTQLMNRGESTVLSKRVKELEAENAGLVQEMKATKDLLYQKSTELARRDSELTDIQTLVNEQHGKIRALHEQLSGFISKDASESARSEIVTQDLARAQEELHERTTQLQKVAKALSKLKEREEATNAALETQTNLVAQLQDRLSSLQSENHRLKQSTQILQQQHTQLTDTVEELREQLHHANEEASAKAQVVEVATRSADSVRVLNAALDNAKKEIDDLKDQLATARVEARRDTINLQRVADERQALITSLQADLSAATAALGSGSTVQSMWINDGPSLDTTTTSARSFARKRGIAVGVTGGKPITTGAHNDAGGGSDASGEIQRLRLQNESLSRRLIAAEERIHTLEQEQDSLLEVNERLRAAHTHGETSHTTTTSFVDLETLCVELSKALVESESIMPDVDRLLSEVGRLFRACDAALDNKTADLSLEPWQDDSTSGPRVAVESRLSGVSASVMMALRKLLDRNFKALPSALLDVRAMRNTIAETTARAAELRNEIQERSAASLGEACVTQ